MVTPLGSAHSLGTGTTCASERDRDYYYYHYDMAECIVRSLIKYLVTFKTSLFIVGD